MPDWKTKFQLNSRKKMSRNTTAINANTTSQPKLYSLVRLSFILVHRHCRSCDCSPRRIRPLADRSNDRDALPANNRKIDPKSTRLNSSHGSISYAVFCLKKKKKKK